MFRWPLLTILLIVAPSFTSFALSEDPTLTKELASLQPLIGKTMRGEFAKSHTRETDSRRF